MMSVFVITDKPSEALVGNSTKSAKKKATNER